MNSPPLWIWTPAFARQVPSGRHFPSYDAIYRPQMRRYWHIVLELRRRKSSHDFEAVVVFDVGRLPDGRDWAYVGDALNRAGENPLRGLGPLLAEPFMDISQLYDVPAASSGVEVTALGDRYPGSLPVGEQGRIAGRGEQGRTDGAMAACGYLHHLALLARAVGLAVTGVVVRDGALAGFDFAPFIPGPANP